MSGLSTDVLAWVVSVYEPAVRTLTEVFRGVGQTDNDADHNARACLARLVNPPITVELLENTT